MRLLPALLAHRLRADAATAPPSAGHLGSGVAITPLVTLADQGLLQATGAARREPDDPWTKELVARGLALQASGASQSMMGGEKSQYSTLLLPPPPFAGG